MRGGGKKMPKEQKVHCGADVRELVCWTKDRNAETLLLRKTPCSPADDAHDSLWVVLNSSL